MCIGFRRIEMSTRLHISPTISLFFSPFLLTLVILVLSSSNGLVFAIYKYTLYLYSTLSFRLFICILRGLNTDADARSGRVNLGGGSTTTNGNVRPNMRRNQD